jgi:hypothetical protein
LQTERRSEDFRERAYGCRLDDAATNALALAMQALAHLLFHCRARVNIFDDASSSRVATFEVRAIASLKRSVRTLDGAEYCDAILM